MNDHYVAGNKTMHGWSVPDKSQGNSWNRKMHYNSKLKQNNEVLNISWIHYQDRAGIELEFQLAIGTNSAQILLVLGQS